MLAGGSQGAERSVTASEGVGETLAGGSQSAVKYPLPSSRHFALWCRDVGSQFAASSRRDGGRVWNGRILAGRFTGR